MCRLALDVVKNVYGKIVVLLGIVVLLALLGYLNHFFVIK